MGEFWKYMLYGLLVFAFVAAITHAAGFATAVGSLFAGQAMVGRTIETAGAK